MNRRYRSFQFDGAPHHLDESPGVRERDIAMGAATVIREATGEAHVLRADQLNIPLPKSVEPIQAQRRVDIRWLIERGLELDYDDRDIVDLVEIARRHAMLREGQREGAS